MPDEKTFNLVLKGKDLDKFNQIKNKLDNNIGELSNSAIFRFLVNDYDIEKPLIKNSGQNSQISSTA